MHNDFAIMCQSRLYIARKSFLYASVFLLISALLIGNYYSALFLFGAFVAADLHRFDTVYPRGGSARVFFLISNAAALLLFIACFAGAFFICGTKAGACISGIDTRLLFLAMLAAHILLTPLYSFLSPYSMIFHGNSFEIGGNVFPIGDIAAIKVADAQSSPAIRLGFKPWITMTLTSGKRFFLPGNTAISSPDGTDSAKGFIAAANAEAADSSSAPARKNSRLPLILFLASIPAGLLAAAAGMKFFSLGDESFLLFFITLVIGLAAALAARCFASLIRS